MGQAHRGWTVHGVMALVKDFDLYLKISGRSKVF